MIGFLELAKLVNPVDHILVDPLLQLIQLPDLFLIDRQDCLHALDGGLGIDLSFSCFKLDVSNTVILQLSVGGLFGILPIKEEVVVLLLLEHGSLNTPDLIDLDGVLSLLLVEGLQKFTHDFPHLGLDLEPFELPHLLLFVPFLLFLRHYFIMALCLDGID